MKNSNLKIKILFLLLIAAIFSISGYSAYSKFYTEGAFSSSATIYFMSFTPVVNDNSEFTQTMNLSNTITNNKPLAPGAKGQFNIKIDFSNIDPSVEYLIEVDKSSLPNNLKLYSDSGYSNEYTTINTTHLKNDLNKIITYPIYWEWKYMNDATSNANDSLFMNKEIKLPFSVSFYQKEDE